MGLRWFGDLMRCDVCGWPIVVVSVWGEWHGISWRPPRPVPTSGFGHVLSRLLVESNLLGYELHVLTRKKTGNA